MTQDKILSNGFELVDGAVPPEGERMRIQANGEMWFVENGRYYRCTIEYKPEPIVIRTTAPVTYNEGTKYAITLNAQGEK